MGDEISTSISIESIKELLDGFDPAALLPELDTIFGKVALACRIAVLLGPALLVLVGLFHLFLTPREANHFLGYRRYYGMGSVQAWRFTQRLSGIVFAVLGIVLSAVGAFVMLSFASLGVEDMVWRAAKCLMWQAGLTLLANLIISGAAFVTFNAKGDYRYKR